MGIVADAFAALEADRLKPQCEIVKFSIQWSPRRARRGKPALKVVCSGSVDVMRNELERFAIVYGVSFKSTFEVKVPGLRCGPMKTDGFTIENPLTNVSFGYYIRGKGSRKEPK